MRVLTDVVEVQAYLRRLEHFDDWCHLFTLLNRFVPGFQASRIEVHISFDWKRQTELSGYGVGVFDLDGKKVDLEALSNELLEALLHGEDWNIHCLHAFQNTRPSPEEVVHVFDMLTVPTFKQMYVKE